MNARLYDPVLRRFLSPDPYVQLPDFTQSFNRYTYGLNNPLLYTDPNGEFFFAAVGVGLWLNAVCWGAAISVASYTLNVAMSPGGFNNWSWGQFGKTVGIGAIAGAATFGVGEIFGATGSFMNEAGRGLAHGLVQGGSSALEGGDFLSGFASGALGSWAGHGASALGITGTKAGKLAFSTVSGGLASWATGGSLLKGAASGLMVGLLNQVQHDVEAKQQEKQWQKTLEKYNDFVKNSNNVASPAIDLAKHFSKAEIAWLKQVGRISKRVGLVTVGADAALTVDALLDGQPWGWHAYDTGLGAVSMMGPAGAAAAASINSYVGAAKYLNNMVNWTNTTGQQRMKNLMIRGY